MLAIVGPTASGKSALALEWARRHGGEILCCDSVQVYRGFAIGCAKANAREQAEVPHHLLDLVEPHEGFDAAQYANAARAVIAAVRARGRRPVLCGGTGLYLRALRYGLIEAPPGDPELRARWSAEEQAAPGTLLRRLRAVDPGSAQAIDAENLVQVMRALEIHALTGEPASVRRARHGFRHEHMPMRVVMLRGAREALRAAIGARVRAMLAAGWIDEVRGLFARGVPPECRPMRAVGYREVVLHVQGALAATELAERIFVATWHYAKRQMTWLRRERDVIPLDVEDIGGQGLQTATAELARLAQDVG